MKTVFRAAITGLLAIVLHGTVFVSKATAQCGYSQWNRTEALQPLSAQEALSRTAENEGSDGQIVGFWKFKFCPRARPAFPTER